MAEAREAPKLSVDAGHVLREGADKFVGINLNYLRDDDANRAHARPLSEALSEMGARWLRYPGGEKSDFYQWSQPPYLKPAPTSLGWYGSVVGERLDFNRYIALARRVGAEPYVVVGYDTLERTGRTREQWLQNAVSWVRYAREKNYGVRYWEIGNENWHNNTARPEEMASIVAEFARAMKAADPGIKIGASGSNSAWWERFLPMAAPHLDFLSLSHYNAWEWKSYEYILQHPNVDLAEGARQAVEAIDRFAPQEDRKRLQVVVAETNSKDYSEGGWAGSNTLGHAIVTFETLGRLMQQPRIASAMVWTTRWVQDEEAAQSQWYALGAANEILPTGRALALWRLGQAKMIAVEGSKGPVAAYATTGEDRRALTLWIVNRGHGQIDGLSVAIKSPVAYKTAALWQLTGTGPDDASPSWKQETAPVVLANSLRGLSCPGVSVSVIVLKA